MNISANIRSFRKEKGLGQEQLGHLLGVSAAMISQWERGERNPKNETLQKIAEALEISLSDLLGQTNPKEVQAMNEQAKTQDQKMKECFRQLFFKLSEASESDDCTADDLMAITQAMLLIYPMFRTLPGLIEAAPDIDVIASGLADQLRKQVTAANSATHTV